MTAATRRSFLSLCVGGLVLSTGCGPGGKNEDFTPGADKAKKALVAALDSWKSGKAPGSIPDTNPKVEVVDWQWRQGVKIKDYEIVGDAPPAQGTGPRTFTVKLSLTSGETFETNYMVIGIDPLWIYRKEDFAKLSG